MKKAKAQKREIISVFDRWAGQVKEIKGDRVNIPGAEIIVNELDTKKEPRDSWTLRGNAEISFFQREGGYIVRVRIADSHLKTVLRFTDEKVYYKAIQDANDGLVFGAFTMPRIIQITDGKTYAQTKLCFKDAHSPEGCVWFNGSVIECTLEKLPEAALRPGATIQPGAWAQSQDVSVITDGAQIGIGKKVISISGQEQWATLNKMVQTSDPDGWTVLKLKAKTAFSGTDIYEYIEYNGVKKSPRYRITARKVTTTKKREVKKQKQLTLEEIEANRKKYVK
jgi:hypothetical protein